MQRINAETTALRMMAHSPVQSRIWIGSREDRSASTRLQITCNGRCSDILHTIAIRELVTFALEWYCFAANYLIIVTNSTMAGVRTGSAPRKFDESLYWEVVSGHVEANSVELAFSLRYRTG